ncbi:MAG: DNA-binding protein WhiA [Oscillospiraceae bacterium]|nr:DNA-binding protein WhiA [Oscillospiraceae bacterium]
MSFSHDVKEELCSLITDRNKEFASLYGMLLFGRHFNEDKVIFRTEHSAAAALFVRLAEKFSGENGCTQTEALSRKDGSVMYTVNVLTASARKSLTLSFKRGENSPRRICEDIIDNSNIFAFIGGAFLSCGSITEPMKDYHLEFDIQTEELCTDLRALINGMGINVKQTLRKSTYVIYLKGSEDIEDMLTLMGATKSSIELMNVKIYKDVRNKANRIANCDSANIERTLAASEKQIEDIELIMARKGIEYLSPDLREIALVRLENPDVSLKELGEMLDNPIGRSGANHRLKKISAIAEELRNR